MQLCLGIYYHNEEIWRLYLQTIKLILWNNGFKSEN